jgi:hypothetical protein
MYFVLFARIVLADGNELLATYAKQNGRCGSAAKQSPHRPGTAPALSLRAGDADSIVPQTNFA